MGRKKEISNAGRNKGDGRTEEEKRKKEISNAGRNKGDDRTEEEKRKKEILIFPLGKIPERKGKDRLHGSIEKDGEVRRGLWKRSERDSIKIRSVIKVKRGQRRRSKRKRLRTVKE